MSRIWPLRRFGRDNPPQAILDLLGDDERVVSWAPTADGALVATRFGLWWPFPDGPRRIEWQLIDKATWQDNAITVIEAELVDDLLLVDRPPISVALPEPRDLPPTIRKRVQGGVVSSELVSGGGVSMRVVGRRVPGRDGVSWWARLEPGTKDTPETRLVVHDVLDTRRAQQSVLENQ
jgi:hypothetical protein